MSKRPIETRSLILNNLRDRNNQLSGSAPRIQIEATVNIPCTQRALFSRWAHAMTSQQSSPLQRSRIFESRTDQLGVSYIPSNYPIGPSWKMDEWVLSYNSMEWPMNDSSLSHFHPSIHVFDSPSRKRKWASQLPLWSESLERNSIAVKPHHHKLPFSLKY